MMKMAILCLVLGLFTFYPPFLPAEAPLVAHGVEGNISTLEQRHPLIALLEPVEDDPRDPISALDEARIGTWLVRFDLDEFLVPHKHMAFYYDLDLEESRTAINLPNPVWLELPEDVGMVQIQLTEVHKGSPNVVSYFGHIDRKHAYAAKFTVNHVTNQVLVQVHYGSRMYLINERLEGDTAHLHVIDKRRTPAFNCIEGSHEYLADGQTNTTSGSADLETLSSQTNGNVRVLFYYTPVVEANAKDGIDVLIDSIVTKMNSTTYSSGIDPKNYVIAADRIETTDDFDWSNYCACCPIHHATGNHLLGKMSGGHGEFSQISSQMDAVYADIAVLLVSNDCSRVGGGILGTHDMNTPEPFAVVTDEYAMSDLTVLHEIGHLLGSGHEITADSHPDPIPNAPNNARGFLEPNPAPGGAQWQTLMGGYQTEEICEFDGTDPSNQSCVRQPIWSNPNSTHDGKATGDSQAFNAEAFNATMPVAASWGVSYPYSAPAGPTLTANHGYCWGFNSIDWSSPANTEIFQLFVDGPHTQGWERMFHGIANHMTFNLSQGESWHLKVRACNGSGCSGFSNTVTIHYHEGCM